MQMNCYQIKIYCFRKAVIMPHLLPLPLPHFFSSLQAGTCLCFALVPFIHFEICRSGNWYRHNLPLSPLLLHSIPRQPHSRTRPKSIHSYLCQTKSKSFMPFLGRRQLFFSQFYWHAAISVSWSLSKWTPSPLPLPSRCFPLFLLAT